MNRKIIGTTAAGIIGMLGFAVGIVELEYGNSHSTKPSDNVVVAYTADPDTRNDGNIVLGYPNHRFSVTCSNGKAKICFIETEIDGKVFVKTFPYVEQEWFTPAHTNRPWHTLDVVKTLPSYNGNTDLHFTKDPVANAALVSVMTKNGWVKN